MTTTVNPVDRLAATTPFIKKAVLARAKQITVTKSRGVVVTKDGDKIISKFRPSKIYEIVSFNDAVVALMSIVSGIFQPEFFTIVIKAGYQELKLKGRSHNINGEIFHEMLWLTNSTDGTKRLSVRYGLMRQVCSNGMCVVHTGTSFQVKHLTSNNVNEELMAFMQSLPKLDATQTIKKLGAVANKVITVGKLSDALVNKTGEKGNDTIWNLLVRKLSSSKTDALGTKEDAIITGINVPFRKMTKETLDTEVPAWKVMNCYTELWRSLNAGEVERETGKILEILEG